jgi:hypothetical protein
MSPLNMVQHHITGRPHILCSQASVTVQLHIRELAAAAAACGADYRQTNERCRSCSTCGIWAAAQACRLFRKVVLNTHRGVLCCMHSSTQCRYRTQDHIGRSTCCCILCGCCSGICLFKESQFGCYTAGTSPVKEVMMFIDARDGPSGESAVLDPRMLCQRTPGSLNASLSCMQALQFLFIDLCTG